MYMNLNCHSSSSFSWLCYDDATEQLQGGRFQCGIAHAVFALSVYRARGIMFSVCPSVTCVRTYVHGSGQRRTLACHWLLLGYLISLLFWSHSKVGCVPIQVFKKKTFWILGAGRASKVSDTVAVVICLQCFDTVGWASGRASGM